MKRANIRTRKPDTVRQWNRTGQNKRNDILNAKAQAAGWDGISNFLTAVIRDEAEIPKKKANIATSLSGTLVKPVV